MARISVAMMTHNETAEFRWLMEALVPALDDERLKVLWEDQFRMLRNLPHLHWTLRFNEYLTGVRRGYRFPHTLDCALLHCKTHGRQARQWVFLSLDPHAAPEPDEELGAQ